MMCCAVLKKVTVTQIKEHDCMVHYGVNILRKCKICVSTNLKKLELDATVSACVCQWQPVEAGQQ